MRSENPIGHSFYELSEVDSTNNYAMAKAQAQMAVHGETWFAHYQKAGKGQRGKPWNAAKGENIMISTVVNPDFLRIDNQFLLNVTIALGCHDFFNYYAKSDTCIKWPNDIYWRDRKAGGILIENVLKGKKWRYSVVGIGLNINQTLFPTDLPNPVSLKQITGKTFDTIQLAKQLCTHLDHRWKQLHNGKYQDLMHDYLNNLYKKGERVTFKTDTALFEATVTGVNWSGELLIDNGEPTKVAFGSVSWLIPT